MTGTAGAVGVRRGQAAGRCSWSLTWRRRSSSSSSAWRCACSSLCALRVALAVDRPVRRDVRERGAMSTATSSSRSTAARWRGAGITDGTRSTCPQGHRRVNAARTTGRAPSGVAGRLGGERFDRSIAEGQAWPPGPVQRSGVRPVAQPVVAGCDASRSRAATLATHCATAWGGSVSGRQPSTVVGGTCHGAGASRTWLQT